MARLLNAGVDSLYLSARGEAKETFGPLRYERDIVRRTPRIENGFLYAPEEPGLGVELDEDAVRAMAMPGS